jgi:ribonuclease P protein component
MSNHRTYQRFTLQAEERLKLRNDIETLFRQGEAFSVYPLRVVFRLSTNQHLHIAPVRVGFSIPKKRLRLAHQRHRVRRLLKEAWRLQKHTVYAHIPPQNQLHCFLIYTGSTDVRAFTFDVAQSVVAKAMHKLLAELALPSTQ